MILIQFTLLPSSSFSHDVLKTKLSLNFDHDMIPSKNFHIKKVFQGELTSKMAKGSTLKFSYYLQFLSLVQNRMCEVFSFFLHYIT